MICRINVHAFVNTYPTCTIEILAFICGAVFFNHFTPVCAVSVFPVVEFACAMAHPASKINRYNVIFPAGSLTGKT